ncbi:hypothetical protein B9479_001148 [Cryptococcus floricola]|uniref:Protein YTP1-like C-terminal domain-containing protein n=1 Tax=Cryptococcus floricola TaxID=2591691 RepID=A0A5D3B7B6_9TREE|nr:hypothetical protein B9479_001148 [Cryptococcus floricola]
MRVAKDTHMLPVTTFLVSTLLLSAVLPVFATPDNAARPALQVKHEGEDDDVPMDMGHAEDAVESTQTRQIPTPVASALGSATSAVHSAAASSPHAAAGHSHGASHDPPSAPHSHGGNQEALTVLNDTDIHRWHKFPPTYLDADFQLDASSAIFGEQFDDAWNLEDIESHKILALSHAFLMGLAYTGLLPISLALRSADHPAHYLANLVFLAAAIVGWLVGAAYSTTTPDYYEGSKYPLFLSILVLTSISLTVVDSLGLIKRGIAFHRRGELSWKGFVHDVLRSASEPDDEKWSASRYEMVGLTENLSDEEVHRGRPNNVVFSIGNDENEEPLQTTEPEPLHDAHGVTQSVMQGTRPHRPTVFIRQHSSPSRTSTGSDYTLQDTPHSSHPTGLHKASQLGAYDAHPHHLEAISEAERERDEQHNNRIWQSSKANGCLRALEVVLTWVRRAQVVFAYVVMIMGIVTYTGMCRANLVNSCAAHYIKGSIFFWYGFLTFARYLGAYADLGWAWNRRPSAHSISAEMVECAVIFTYGITNTWMERFGAAPGSPFTVKQVQHISIAVMFWFAGLSGMLLESKWVRRVLGSVMSTGRSSTKEPDTYAFSFNPLPALTIGVTGLAMAAHHQTYVFQVQIHSLWGILLFGGSVFRCLTYFFLFLSPPSQSALPSRPPTEILTSFGWAAGGIVFMLSNEEIAWAAMRAGWDDMMAFLNFTIALTCLVFCWGVVVMAVKGWAVLRSRKEEERRGGVEV